MCECTYEFRAKQERFEKIFLLIVANYEYQCIDTEAFLLLSCHSKAITMEGIPHLWTFNNLLQNKCQKEHAKDETDQKGGIQLTTKCQSTHLKLFSERQQNHQSYP